MKKRNLISITLLTLTLVFTCFTISFAEPSQLIVVRASDNSLWKATCDGLSCTSFTSFPGLFTSQPAVLWDEDLYRYVLWGRGTDGAIWRSTFTRTGTFNNDWTVPIPGSTASPPGAAGGGIASNWASTNPTHTGVTVPTSTVNVKTRSITVPFGGFAQCTAMGLADIYHSSGTDSYVYIYMTDASGGEEDTFTLAGVPSTYPTGYVVFPYAITRWFSVSAGSYTFYTTANSTQTTNIGLWDNTMYCTFYPYSF